MVVLEFMEYGSLSSALADAAGIASGDGRHTFEMQWAIQIGQFDVGTGAGNRPLKRRVV